MTGNYGVMAVTITGALVCGMMLALLGGLKLALAKRLELGEGRVGALLSVLNLALLPMVLLCGVVLDRWGTRAVMILGSLVLCLAVLALGARLSRNGALVAVLAAGLGGAAVATASMVLMPRAFFPNQPSASLNLGNVFVALGALVGAALTDVLLRTMDLKRALGLFAFVCLVPGVAAAVPRNLDVASHSHASLAALLNPSAVSLWMAGLVFFFYAPLEASVSVWATSYLTELGHDERRAGRLLAGFWAAFLASRLLVALAQHAGWLPQAADGWVLVVAALLAAVVLGNLAGTANRNNAPIALVLLGLLLGPIFPTLLGVVFRSSPEEQWGTAFGSVFALGSLGALLLAPVVGVAAHRRSVQAALRVPMLLALLLTAVALVFALMVA
jgi:fucose permease